MSLQFLITLELVSNPAVWRRVVVPGSMTFHDFYRLIHQHLGKRYEARKQIENSINLLMPIPEIECAIMSKSDRIALFAYRQKPTELKDDFDREVTSGIRVMCRENKDKDQMFSVMANGFLFTEVSYPDVYRW